MLLALLHRRRREARPCGQRHLRGLRLPVVRSGKRRRCTSGTRPHREPRARVRWRRHRQQLRHRVQPFGRQWARLRPCARRAPPGPLSSGPGGPRPAGRHRSGARQTTQLASAARCVREGGHPGAIRRDLAPRGCGLLGRPPPPAAGLPSRRRHRRRALSQARCRPARAASWRWSSSTCLALSPRRQR